MHCSSLTLDRRVTVLAAATVVYALAASQAVVAQANLVLNPGFEDGITSWSANSVSFGWAPNPAAGNARTGEGSAYNGAPQNDPAVLSQSVQATTANVCYRISYWVRSDTQPGSATSATFGDSSSGDMSYTNQYTQTVFYARAQANDEILSFSSFNQDGFNFVDDVSVTAATPEQLVRCKPLPSGVVARRQKSRRAMSQLAFDTSCESKAAGRHWCPIKQGSTNSVCIDTNTEIEYCGASCVNCLAITGAQGVECVEGACHVTSCQEGYKLDDGTCV